MVYFWLYIGVLTAWALITIGGAAQSAVTAKKKGTKELGGTSIMPGIVLMPALFTFIAWVVNLVREPMGLWLVGVLHVFSGVWALGYISYAIYYTKSNDQKP